MKDITLDRATALQLDPHGSDGALDPAADRDFLRDDAAVDLRAIADQEVGGAHLAFDSPVDLRRAIAFDIADDRHAAADARDRSGVHGGLGPRHFRRDNRAFRCRHRDFDCTCDSKAIRFRYLAFHDPTFEHFYPLSCAPTEQFVDEWNLLNVPSGWIRPVVLYSIGNRVDRADRLSATVRPSFFPSVGEFIGRCSVLLCELSEDAHEGAVTLRAALGREHKRPSLIVRPKILYPRGRIARRGDRRACRRRNSRSTAGGPRPWTVVGCRPRGRDGETGAIPRQRQGAGRTPHRAVDDGHAAERWRRARTEHQDGTHTIFLERFGTQHDRYERPIPKPRQAAGRIAAPPLAHARLVGRAPVAVGCKPVADRKRIAPGLLDGQAPLRAADRERLSAFSHQ